MILEKFPEVLNNELRGASFPVFLETLG